jgi:hypothetical protein
VVSSTSRHGLLACSAESDAERRTDGMFESKDEVEEDDEEEDEDEDEENVEGEEEDEEEELWGESTAMEVANGDPAELFGETLLYAAWMDSGVSPLCMVDRDIVLRSPVLRDMACSSSWFDFRLRLSKSSCATTGVTREENAPRRVK